LPFSQNGEKKVTRFGNYSDDIAININSRLQALTKDISTPADIAPSALKTMIFYCLMGYISALIYYLLLLLLAVWTAVRLKTAGDVIR